MEFFEAAILSGVFVLDALFFVLDAVSAVFFPSKFMKWRRGRFRAPAGLPLVAMLAGALAAGFAIYLRSAYHISFWFAPAALLAVPILVYFLWLWFAWPDERAR